MARAILFVVMLALLPVAYGQEKPKVQKGPSPGEVLKAWCEAAAKRDMEAVRKLASKDVDKKVLDAIEKDGSLVYRGQTKVIHEEISGNRAVVVFRVEVGGPVYTANVTYRMALLLREDGGWKFSREEGRAVLKPAKR